jgi:hypothetical protein
METLKTLNVIQIEKIYLFFCAICVPLLHETLPHELPLVRDNCFHSRSIKGRLLTIC